ncbi:MAG: AbrB/MazE/SpoVT family DNA-binding domain-containing protein [Pseudomonadota bacterium]
MTNLTRKYIGDTMVFGDIREDFMIKKLVKHGNSLALVIDRPILELLKINEDTPLEISTDDGQTLKVKPAKYFKDVMERQNKRFSKTLKNLAK